MPGLSFSWSPNLFRSLGPDLVGFDRDSMAAVYELRLGGTTWDWVENSGLRIAVQVRGTAEQLSPNSHFPRSGPPDGSPAWFPPNCERLVSFVAARCWVAQSRYEALFPESAGCLAAQPRSSALWNVAGWIVAEKRQA